MWGKAEWSSSPVRHCCLSDSGLHLHPNLFWSILLSSHFYRNWFQNENTGNRWCQGTSTDMVSWWCNVFILCLVMVCCWCVSCFFLLCRDTAGQERYQTITKQYYRRAQVIPPYLPSLEPGCLHGSWEHSDSNHSLLWTLVQGIIFVYDITNQPSFQHLAKWVSDVDEVSQSSTLISPSHSRCPS